MFRSIFDHPQGDIFSFTSVTKDKIVWFVVACSFYLLYFVLMLLRALPGLVVATTRLGRARSNINTKHKYNRMYLGGVWDWAYFVVSMLT